MSTAPGNLTISDARLRAVYEAASQLFAARGYGPTQVSQIAERANIATGTIYNLFAGKKAILHFVLLANLNPGGFTEEVQLPIREVPDAHLADTLTPILEQLFQRLAALNASGHPVLSFREILEELFDDIYRFNRAFSIINDNPKELPLAAAQYRSGVDKLYELLDQHLRLYMQAGQVRPIKYPHLHIRNIIEGITWWAIYLPLQAVNLDAWNRYGSQGLSAAEAKEIALDVLCHAYLINPHS